MTQNDYNNACRWANKMLPKYKEEMALDLIDKGYGLPQSVSDELYDLMETWCDDNGFAEGEWLEYGDIDEVFFNFDAID